MALRPWYITLRSPSCLSLKNIRCLTFHPIHSALGCFPSPSCCVRFIIVHDESICCQRQNGRDKRGSRANLLLDCFFSCRVYGTLLDDGVSRLVAVSCIAEVKSTCCLLSNKQSFAPHFRYAEANLVAPFRFVTPCPLLRSSMASYTVVHPV